jgi:hypothetical protein
MEYLNQKIQFCEQNPNIVLGKEIKEVAEINKFLNENKKEL